MKEGFDHIDDLIGKYLSHEATMDERTQVEEWISASKENRDYFNHLQLIFEKAASVKTLQEFDADKAWNVVREKLKTSKGRTISIVPTFWPILRAAAAILIMVGIGYLTYEWLNKPTQTLALKSENKILRDTLPDGSLAVLNKGSSIKYAYSPSSKKRRVSLEGEAFFEVKHEEEKSFIIETEDVIIEDIGTTFNVKAFPESPTIEVYVETGEVAFYTLANPGLNLVAGETGIYHKQSKSFARLLKLDTNKLAYKTGVFTFHNTDLGTIVNDLNEVYDTKIRLANPALASCRLNVTFRNEKIEDVADIIAETLKLTMTREGDVIVLNGKSCSD